MSRSEFDFIAGIRDAAAKLCARDHEGLLRGIGDDAAVIAQQPGRDTVVTADLLVEDVDFRRATISPDDLGYKALAVSLSDIAAMGARPRWALLSVGIPAKDWDAGYANFLYTGVFEAAHQFQVTIIGGDVSRTPERVVIDSVVVGETAHERSVLRSGARPGDQIFVTGTLGGAAAGLRLLEHGGRLRTEAARKRFLDGLAKLTRRHTRPHPRVAWGTLLGEKQLATAMIDLSDGLSSDLAHLCRESNAGAVVDAARLPVSPHIRQALELRDHPVTRRLQRDALDLALHGGEDFELLFTVRPRDAARLPRRVGNVGVTHIGEITAAADGIRLKQGRSIEPLAPAGFQHFASR